MLRLLIAASLACMLAACGGDGPDAPGAVSAGEAEALEQAAEMLDARRLPPEALPPEVTPTTAPSPAEMTGDTAAPSGE
jgi:hypothetical protein